MHSTPATRQPLQGPSRRAFSHLAPTRRRRLSEHTPQLAPGQRGRSLALEARCVHVGRPAARARQPLTSASPPAHSPFPQLRDPLEAEKSSRRSETNHHKMWLNGTTRVVTENGVSIRKKALCPDVGHSSPTLLKTQINHTGLTYLEQENHGSSLLSRQWSRRPAHTSLRNAKNK